MSGFTSLEDAIRPFTNPHGFLESETIPSRFGVLADGRHDRCSCLNLSTAIVGLRRWIAVRGGGREVWERVL